MLLSMVCMQLGSVPGNLAYFTGYEAGKVLLPGESWPHACYSHLPAMHQPTLTCMVLLPGQPLRVSHHASAGHDTLRSIARHWSYQLMLATTRSVIEPTLLLMECPAP